MTKSNLIAPLNRLTKNTLKVHHDISFWDGEKSIGKLFWDNGVMEFEGDAKKSAKRFFEFLRLYIDDCIEGGND